MICGRCPDGRRFAQGCTYCRFYGMILPDSHECRQERGKQHERNNSYRLEGYDGPEVQHNGGWFAGSGEEILPGSGERGGIPEMDQEPEGGAE